MSFLQCGMTTDSGFRVNMQCAQASVMNIISASKREFHVAVLQVSSLCIDQLVSIDLNTRHQTKKYPQSLNEYDLSRVHFSGIQIVCVLRTASATSFQYIVLICICKRRLLLYLCGLGVYS